MIRPGRPGSNGCVEASLRRTTNRGTTAWTSPPTSHDSPVNQATTSPGRGLTRLDNPGPHGCSDDFTSPTGSRKPSPPTGSPPPSPPSPKPARQQTRQRHSRRSRLRLAKSSRSASGVSPATRPPSKPAPTPPSSPNGSTKRRRTRRQHARSSTPHLPPLERRNLPSAPTRSGRSLRDSETSHNACRPSTQRRRARSTKHSGSRSVTNTQVGPRPLGRGPCPRIAIASYSTHKRPAHRAISVATASDRAGRASAT